MLRAALLLALLSGVAGATSITAVVNGNWNNTATWSPAQIPVAGDVVTLVSTQVVTIPAGYDASSSSVTLVAGTSGAHTKLIINGTLTVSSDVVMGPAGGNTELDMSSGTTLNLGGHNIVMSANSFAISYFHFFGNASSHTVVNGGGGTFTQNNGGGFDFMDSSWTYVDFSSMATNTTAYNGTAHVANFAMSHCTWVNSGQLSVPFFPGGDASVNKYIEYSDFRSGTAADAIRFYNTTGVHATGRNEMINSTVNSGPQISIQLDASSMTFKGNVFSSTTLTSGTASKPDVDFENNVMLNSYVSFAGSDTINNNFWYSESDNPHWFAGQVASTQVYTNNILETNTQGTITDDGDILLESAQTGESSVTFKNNLHIGHRNSSVLLSMQGSATTTTTVHMDNNTNYWDPATSVTKDCNRVGETYAGRTGMIPSVRNNLCVAKTLNATGWIIRDATVGILNKIVSADYNGWFNLATSSASRYQPAVTAPGYGVDDINADPKFTDPTRELLTWDTSIGGAGTSADAVSNFLQLNGYGGTYNTAYNLSSLMSYIKTGFTPTNQVYKAAGFDGSDIGAFPVGAAVSAATSTTNFEMFSRQNVHGLGNFILK